MFYCFELFWCIDMFHAVPYFVRWDIKLSQLSPSGFNHGRVPPKTISGKSNAWHAAMLEQSKTIYNISILKRNYNSREGDISACVTSWSRNSRLAAGQKEQYGSPALMLRSKASQQFPAPAKQTKTLVAGVKGQPSNFHGILQHVLKPENTH